MTDLMCNETPRQRLLAVLDTVEGLGSQEAEALVDAVAQRAGWQPIATAPKDGTPILGAWCWAPGDHWMITTLVWTEGGGWFERLTAWHRLSHCVPKYWMPLPEPPTVEVSQ